MTIYYVDPATGSNTNAGTSWGAAWRWLPGDGTPILPGDEVRFAKSGKRTTEVAYARTTSALTLGSGYAAVSATSGTWTSAGVTGVTATTNGVSITNGTVVPANTKLGYRAQAISNSTLYGIVAGMLASWAPDGEVGEHFKICICSDSAGNTPVYTLHGSVSNNGTTSNALHRFLHDNGSTPLALTGASIAIYSGTQGFTQNSGATKTFTLNLVFTFTPRSDSPEYLIPGSVVAFSTLVRQAAHVCPLSVDVDSFTSTTAVYSSVSQMPMATAAALYDHYLPTNLPMHVLHAPQTFSGAPGSPVLLRGGYDPASGLQDGYTNLHDGTGLIKGLRGGFTFSAGGDYLELERFLSSKLPLVHWGHITNATVNYVKATDCTLFCLSVNNSSTLASIDYLTLVRCHPRTFPVVQKATGTAMAVVLGYAGTWLFEDCFTVRVGNSTTDAILLNNEMRFYGTATGRSLLVGTSSRFSFSNNSPGTLKLESTLLGQSMGFSGQASAAGTAASVYARDVWLVGYTTGATAVAMQLYNFTDYDLEGFTFDGGSTATLTLDCVFQAAAWIANLGGPGATCTVRGSMVHLAGTGPNIDVRGMHSVLGEGLSCSGALYPNVCFRDCRNVVWDGGDWSWITAMYTDTETLSYIPTTYQRDGIELRNLTAGFAFNCPPWWVRCVNCQIVTGSHTGAYNSAVTVWVNPSNFGFLRSCMTFGCTAVRPEGGAVSASLNTQSGHAGKRNAPARHYGLGGNFQYTAYTPAAGPPLEIQMAAGSLPTGTLGGSGDSQGSGADTYLRSDVWKFHTRHASGYSMNGTLSAYDRPVIYLNSSADIATVVVLAGQTLTVSGIAFLTTASEPLRIVVPPVRGYAKGIDEHVKQVSSRLHNAEVSFSFSFSPTEDALLQVIVATSQTTATGCQIRKIDVDVA